MRVLFNVSFNKSKCSDELEKYSFPKLNQMIRHSSVKDVEGVDTYKALCQLKKHSIIVKLEYVII